MATKTIHQVREEFPNHIIISETLPNSQTQIKKYPFKTQALANEFLKNTDNKNLWYVSDYDKPIKLHIDFDYPIVEQGDFIEGVELYNKVKGLIEGEVIAVAERKGDNKLSKRIFTNMEFENTESLKYYMKDFILKNDLSKSIVDTSIYSKNRLYPIVNYNIKKDRMMTWQSGLSNLEICNPNNNIEGVKIKFDIPVAIEKRKQHGKKKIQEYKTETKDINKLLFLDLLNIIPSSRWDDYDEWLKLATFCKTFFDAKLFIAISRTGNKFESEEECMNMYNGIKSTINAGYIVNIAKEISSQRVSELYYSHRFSKETLTEKSVAKAVDYYFGSVFRCCNDKLYSFRKYENRWDVTRPREFRKFFDKLDEYLTPLFVDKEGGVNRKLLSRYNNLVGSVSGTKNIMTFMLDYVEEIDTESWDLNNVDKLFYKNGYYDFNEKSFKYTISHEFLNTKCMDFNYQSSTLKDKNIIMDFIKQILPYEDDLEIFKNMVGTAITGKRQKEILIIEGEGNNGKSALLPLIKAAFGLYGVKGTASLFTKEVSSDGARNDIQKLQNSRLCYIPEPDTTKPMNIASFKMLTGGDAIEARLQFSKISVEFVVHSLFLIGCNEMTGVKNADKAVMSRIVKMTAPSRFIKQNEYDTLQDTTNIYVGDLKYTTEEWRRENTMTMLNLIIDWANQYKDIPITLSDRIKDNNKEYCENDITDFLDENYEAVDKDVFVELKDVFPMYQQQDKVTMKKDFYKTIQNSDYYGKYFYKQKTINKKIKKNILWKFQQIVSVSKDSDSD